MINEKKVSIIVAIYKSEKFLNKLIDSLISQTYENIEIILVDDGSPDNSGRICDEYAKKDDRIRVIHKENGGACEARNVGMAAATGDYIVIVDGDDWLSLDYTEYMMQLINETQSDMAFSDNIFTTRDQVQVESDQIEVWSAEDATAAIIYPHMPIGPWNKIYSTELLRKNNITFSVPWSGEGLYFASTAAQYSNHVGVGHRKVYNYRLNNINSGLTNYNVQMGINALQNIKYIGENLHIKTPKLINAVNWHIWKNYNFLLMLIIATDSKEKYHDEYKECIKKIRQDLPKVLIRSEMSFYQKLGMLHMGLCPRSCAKKNIRETQKGLANDRME